jgi:hypothetical protein
LQRIHAILLHQGAPAIAGALLRVDNRRRLEAGEQLSAASDRPWSRFQCSGSMPSWWIVGDSLRGREQRFGLRGFEPLIHRELVPVESVDRRRGIEGAGRLRQW